MNTSQFPRDEWLQDPMLGGVLPGCRGDQATLPEDDATALRLGTPGAKAINLDDLLIPFASCNCTILRGGSVYLIH